MLFDPRRLKSGKQLARLAADRAALRFAHGLQLVMDGGMAPTGTTPKEEIFARDKLRVFHYLRRQPDEFELGHDTHAIAADTLPTPVLLIPPLMVRTYIYDLRPEHSMVRALRRANLDIYLLDFGVPDRDDLTVSLDDYVLSYVPAAVEAVRSHSGRSEISIAGYCMGGIFGLLYTAAWADTHVRNLVTIGAPIDFSQMGVLTAVARLAHRQAPQIVDRIGNIPGVINATGLKLLAPIKFFTRYADLFVNLWNEEYVRGFESMHRWTNDFIPYPRDAFKQLVQQFMVENRLVEQMSFGDKTADLRSLECSLLAFAGTGDTIATPKSTRALCDVVAARDFDFLEVPGGHIGVVAGTSAPSQVWKPTCDWLVPRST